MSRNNNTDLNRDDSGEWTFPRSESFRISNAVLGITRIILKYDIFKALNASWRRENLKDEIAT